MTVGLGNLSDKVSVIAPDGTEIGNVGDRLKVDTGIPLSSSGEVVVVEGEEHDALEEGTLFTHRHIHNIGNGNVSYHLMETPSSPLFYFWWSLNTTGAGKAEFFKEPTVSANGTEGNNFARNRNASDTSPLKCYHGPTVSADGTLLESISFGANGGGKQGTTESMVWKLKPSTKYLLKYTSAASNNDFSENLGWYPE
jgi:hypothetical protein